MVCSTALVAHCVINSDDHLLKKTENLERPFAKSGERVEYFFSKNLCQLLDTLFGSFGFFCTDNHKLLNNMTLFDFESFIVEAQGFRDTETMA